MSTTWKGVLTKATSPLARSRREGLGGQAQEVSLIVPASLRAVETVYLAAMLEEARVFDAADRLVAMFVSGSMPIRPGAADKALYSRWKGNGGRLMSGHRATLYSRLFGISRQGNTPVINRKFEDLWLRFVSTAGMYAAELHSLPASERSVSAEELRGSGRDLAAHLSLQGQGIAMLAATDLKKDIAEIMDLLGDPEIRALFGATDCWRLLDRLWEAQPGPKPNVARSRTRAEAGRVIIRWLANRRTVLSRSGGRVLREDHLRERRSAATLEKQRTYPTDYDLVRACEQWLAATGTEDELVAA